MKMEKVNEQIISVGNQCSCGVIDNGLNGEIIGFIVVANTYGNEIYKECIDRRIDLGVEQFARMQLEEFSCTVDGKIEYNAVLHKYDEDMHDGEYRYGLFHFVKT